MKMIKRTLIILIIATTIFTVVKCNRTEDEDNIKQEQGEVSLPKDDNKGEQDKEKHKDDIKDEGDNQNEEEQDKNEEPKEENQNDKEKEEIKSPVELG